MCDVAPVSMSPFSIDGTLSVQTRKRINANSLQQNYDIQLDERHNQGKYRVKRSLITKACVFSNCIKLMTCRVHAEIIAAYADALKALMV